MINNADLLPFGIVNTDLNGLKQVNDNLGHDAGDDMLCEASAFLREMFDGDEIYRAGGDEFIVLVMGTDRESFERRWLIIYSRAIKNVYGRKR